MILGGSSATNLTGLALAALINRTSAIVPGSGGGTSIVLSSTTSTASIFAFRLYFPYRTAGGVGQMLVPVAGSYTVDIDLTFNSADTVTVTNTIGASITNHTTTWNGITAWSYATGADSAGLYKLTNRFDVNPAPIQTAPGSTDTLGPFVDYVFTDATAGTHYGICAIRINSMGTSSSTGPQVFGTTRDGKFFSVRRWLLVATDGIIAFDDQLPPIEVAERRYFHTIKPDAFSPTFAANVPRVSPADSKCEKHRPLSDFKVDRLHYNIKPVDFPALASSLDEDDWLLLRDLPYAPSCVSPLCNNGSTDTMCYVCLRAAYLRIENLHPSSATAVKGGLGALAATAPVNRKTLPK
jgi:hypothetical protein